MRKLTKTQQIERDKSIEELREILSTHDHVFGIVKHVSQSGMSRIIDFHVIDGDDLLCISNLVAKVNGNKFVNDRYRGIKISGCGMDMGWNEIYNARRRCGLGAAFSRALAETDNISEESINLGYGFDLRYL